MHALAADELLHVWERGLVRSPAERALLLLVAARPEILPEELARFSIGQRDRSLLALRERTFGLRLTSLSDCPACAEMVEVQLETADLYAAKPEVEGPFSLTLADHAVEFRLPSSLDLASLNPAEDLAQNKQRLLQRCLVTLRRGGTEIGPENLPDEVAAAVIERMAELDPQAEVQLSLTCPQCEHAWQTPLDIVDYFWREIQAWARRVLREIHLLASAYGWAEAEILALTPWRRRAYLELIRS